MERWLYDAGKADTMQPWRAKVWAFVDRIAQEEQRVKVWPELSPNLGP
jgi:hypothetical protein